jgi:hypothetical protein
MPLPYLFMSNYLIYLKIFILFLTGLLWNLLLHQGADGVEPLGEEPAEGSTPSLAIKPLGLDRQIQPPHLF